MALKLTPVNLRHAYEFLCHTEPFDKWNMPASDNFIFRVLRDKAHRGWYLHWRPIGQGANVIGISRSCIGFTDNLIRTMAHEMIHVHQHHVGMETRGVQHNAAFLKLAAKVCKAHGFDEKLF